MRECNYYPECKSPAEVLRSARLKHGIECRGIPSAERAKRAKRIAELDARIRKLLAT